MSSKRRDELDQDEHEGSEEPSEVGAVGTKRKITRACDICRRRKHRCDGAETKGACTNCTVGNLKCTYVESSKRRATPKGYVESLENRCRALVELLKEARPGFDVDEELGVLPPETHFSNRRPAILPKTESASSSTPKIPPPAPPTPQEPPPFNPSNPTPQHPPPPQQLQMTDIIRGLATNSKESYYPLPPPQFPSAAFASASCLLPPIKAHHHMEDYQVLTATSSRLTNAAIHPLHQHRPPFAYPPASSAVRDEAPATQSERLQKGKDEDEDEFLRRFVKLNRPDEIVFRSFYGKSSFLPLLWSAIGFKYGTNAARYKEESALHPASPEHSLWHIPVWEIPSDSKPSPWIADGPLFESWPAPDLASDLIDSFFGYPSIYLPLLQRPHFLRQFSSQLYLSDPGFARLCFLVFAVGSMHSTDTRTRFPLPDGGLADVRSSGWIYYHSFRKLAKPDLAPTDLYDLQTIVLLVSFLRVQSSRPRSCWGIIGGGLRAAVDVGVHRKDVQRSPDLAENELFKRSFWCLQILDSEFAVLLGRPPNLDEINFDATLDFDAGFWQEGEILEPHGHASKLEAFVLQVQLSIIVSRANAQLYGIKPRPDNGLTSQQLAQSLDAQVQEWANSIPPHLRWNTSAPTSLDFALSAQLSLEYHNTLTLIHRPFLPSPQHPISTSPESVTSAIDAAIASIKIMAEVSDRRFPLPPSSYFAINAASMILLIRIWGGTAGEETAIQMDYVERAIELLEEGAKKYTGVGRTIASISVMAAPRVDYLAESLARRKEREFRVAQAEAVQETLRANLNQSPHSSSAASPSFSSSLSHHGASPHNPSPSTTNSPHVVNPLNPPQDSQSTVFDASTAGILPLGTQAFDVISFDSNSFNVYPDFFAATGPDPEMTLFPSSSEPFVTADPYATFFANFPHVATAGSGGGPQPPQDPPTPAWVHGAANEVGFGPGDGGPGEPWVGSR